MDLIKLITDKLTEVESSGKLEEIVERNVIKCLEDVVGSSFNWGGEAKKSIEEALKEKLKINPENLNLDRYSKIVSDIVKKRLNGTVIESLKNKVEESVDSITSVLSKSEWKLSEIMDEFLDSIDTSYDVMEEQVGECTLIVEVDGSFAHIYIDKETDKQKYQCENRIYLHEGKVFYAQINERQLSPFVMYNMNKFEELIFKLYCNNASMELDEDYCNVVYYREDCD